MGIKVPNRQELKSHTRQEFHAIHSLSWETLVAIGYVNGASTRMYTENVTGLVAADGECSFFGEAHLEPELQPATPAVDEAFYANSSSASDTGKLLCWMQDALGNETVVTATMTGTTPVLLGNYVHCNQIEYAGGDTQNVGDMYVSTKSDAGVPLVITDLVQCHIGIGRGHGNNPRQRCPLNEVMVFLEQQVSSDKLDGIHIRQYHSRILTGQSGVHKMLQKQWLIYQSVESEEFLIPIVLEPLEELLLTISRSAAGTGAVNAVIDMSVYEINGATGVSGGAGINLLFD